MVGGWIQTITTGLHPERGAQGVSGVFQDELGLERNMLIKYIEGLGYSNGLTKD